MEEKKKHIYAKQCYCDGDRVEYYTEDEAKEDLVGSIPNQSLHGGHTRGYSLNEDLAGDVIIAIRDVEEDLDTLRLEESAYSEEEYEEERKKIAEQWFEGIREKSEPYTDEELAKIIKIAESYDDYDDREYGALLDALEIAYGKKFKYSCFTGYSQGDWMEVVYPEEIEDRVSYIEAAVMGKGSEWDVLVTDQEIDAATLMREDLYDIDFESLTILVPDTSDTKAYIAKSVGMGLAKDDVTALSITGTKKIVRYEHTYGII